MNTGTTTWNTNYYIQYTGGDNLGLKLTKYQMPYAVPPQMSVQFTFDFTAPDAAGTVKNNWNIVNPPTILPLAFSGVSTTLSLNSRDELLKNEIKAEAYNLGFVEIGFTSPRTLT